MTNREPRTVRINPEVWSRFTDQVVEWEGQKHGEIGRHVENALEEYIDHGREARIEETVNEILTHVRDGGTTHAHTAMSASDSVEKARQIHTRLADNHGEIIKDDDVTRSVEDLAGADPRTVAKYREILKRRGLLFEHPGDSAVWTVERETWIEWAENYIDNNPLVEISDVVTDYGIGIEEYAEMAETVA